MPHFADFSARSALRRVQIAVWVVGVAGAVVAECLAFNGGRPDPWLPDLVVGASFVFLGGLACVRASGAGFLLAAAGAAWFVGTVVPEATFWHRGVLVQLLVSYPRARPASRAGWTVAVVGYASAVVGPVWSNDASSAVLAGAACCLCVVEARRASAGRRRSRLVSCRAGAILAVTVLLGSLARLVEPAGSAALPSLLTYEAALIGVAFYLWSGLRPAAPIAVTNLVIELGENQSATMRDALADVLGDPSLRLGYWQPPTGAYVDGARQILEVPGPGGGQVMTEFEHEGRPFAALLHDSSLAADPTFTAAIAAAERLTAAHAALHADVQARVAEVSASRRRLQAATDEERRRLERRLAAGPEPWLAGMLGDLRGLAAARNTHIERAVDQLARTMVELHGAAQGLYPRDLASGLSVGLAELADRCPVPVELSVVGRRFDPQIEVATYYLCAEALTNIAKHARASSVSIEVRVLSEVLVVRVTDDGLGGAAPEGGTGLLGLADRIESIGGRLRVESEPGAGTSLTAEIPLDGQAR